MTLPDGPELALPSGDVTEGVVRVGDTVRRPHQPSSERVAAYLGHLERAGFDRAPHYLGRDASGRDAFTFVAGDVPGDPVDSWAQTDEVLPGVGRLLRLLHDASGGFSLDEPEPEPGTPVRELPAGESVIVSQRDLTPQNTVFRDGQAWGLIDFDLTGTTTRSTDLVNTAMHWVPLSDPVDRFGDRTDDETFARFCAIYDAYGRDHVDVALLLEAARLRFGGLYTTMKWAADTRGGGWRRMWDEGIGDVITRRVAWFDRVRDDMAAALTRPKEDS